jgi:uncharacterized protein (DUF2147 family)
VPLCPFRAVFAFTGSNIIKPLCQKFLYMTQLKKITGIILVFLLLASAGFAQTANSITGNWKNEEKDKPMEMEIYLAKDGSYYGKVINSSDPAKNGTLTIKSLRYDEAAKKWKGSLQPPDMNMTLNVTVTMENANRLKMVARKLLMSKTIYLTRTK